MGFNSFQYNMPEKKTIHKLYVKTITIKSQNQEKTRISFSIYGNGEKMIHLVIFKGGKNGKISKIYVKKNY